MKLYKPQPTITPYNPFMPRPIDLTRATFVLIRQSKEGSALLRAESRRKQLALIPIALELRKDGREDMVWVYDEYEVSGRYRIHERPEMQRLFDDLAAGKLGSGVIISEDRMFRDEYMTQVSPFVEAAAKAGLQLFVPELGNYYDFSEYTNQKKFFDVEDERK